MAPSPPHTSFPGSNFDGHLSSIVFFISPQFPLKLFQKYLHPLNPYSKRSPWADHMPARFDLWEGGAQTELAKQTSFSSVYLTSKIELH